MGCPEASLCIVVCIEVAIGINGGSISGSHLCYCYFLIFVLMVSGTVVVLVSKSCVGRPMNEEMVQFSYVHCSGFSQKLRGQY